jgi:hypothetical protein
MVNLFITAREIASSFEFCARLWFSKSDDVKDVCNIYQEWLPWYTYGNGTRALLFFCEWDHHKMSFIRFVFLHDILLMVKQRMINKMGTNVKFYPNFISYL